MSRSNDEMTGGVAILFIAIIVTCAYGAYASYNHFNTEVRKLNCQDVYDSLPCRANMQIREDAEAQISVLKRRVKDIKAEQLKVNYE